VLLCYCVNLTGKKKFTGEEIYIRNSTFEIFRLIFTDRFGCALNGCAVRACNKRRTLSREAFAVPQTLRCASFSFSSASLQLLAFMWTERYFKTLEENSLKASCVFASEQREAKKLKTFSTDRCLCVRAMKAFDGKPTCFSSLYSSF